MTAITLEYIAGHVDGTVIGDRSLKVDHAAGLEDAGPGAITFFAIPQHTSHFVERYQRMLRETRATAAIVPRDIADGPCALIQVDNPDLAFAWVVAQLYPPAPGPETGIAPSAVVHADARVAGSAAVGACAVIEAGAVVGERSVIYPNVYVGAGTVIGDDCCIYPGAVLYHNVTLGNNVIIHANAVIGSDGFGYAWDGKCHRKVPQVGVVEIQDGVEIGACTTIDRARLGRTVIGQGTKLDNLVQIAHNVKLGAHCAFASQVGISGSAEFGNGVLMGGQAGAAGHIKVGDGAIFSARAGVSKDFPGGAHYTGYPARPHQQQLNEWRNLKAMGRLRATVRNLERKITELEKKMNSSAAERVEADES